MEWLDAMNRALEYLEKNLDGEADIGEAARIAYSSRFHFQRLFMVLCGVTVADYVRSRRLTLAAQELAMGDCRVLDIALKYGYETPEAFARAFRRFHGVTPSEAREPGVRLKAVPRLKFIISIKGETDMDYRIMKKDAFRIVGKALRVSTVDGQNFTEIPKFWMQCNSDGTTDKLVGLSDDATTLGVCANFSPEMNEFDYYVAAPNQAGAVPEGCTQYTVPALTWAVFDAVGSLPNSIQSLMPKIYSEWFPASSFEHADGPELEVYPMGEMDEHYRCEVWIPVVKKQ
jgi:AraC family transcriptional regulator